MEKLSTVSLKIARELSDRSVFHVDEAALVIEVNMKDALPVIIAEYGSKANAKYDEMKIKVGQAFGTGAYVKLGYELAQLKSKKAEVNRAMSAISTSAKYAALRDFVANEFGDDVLRKFYDQWEEKEK
jgi:predicted RNA-binding protein YlxR (DUF448 family)